MANWKEKVGLFAQNALAKGKEVAEITRLNVEISTLEQKVRETYAKMGEYLAAHPEMIPEGDEALAANMAQLAELNDKIAQDRAALEEVRKGDDAPAAPAAAEAPAEAPAAEEAEECAKEAEKAPAEE